MIIMLLHYLESTFILSTGQLAHIGWWSPGPGGVFTAMPVSTCGWGILESRSMVQLLAYKVTMAFV